MYKPGELQTAPAGCKMDEDGFCELDHGEHQHPADSNGEYALLFGGAFLPHSCNKWVIGGPDQIRALIADLEQALITLGVNVVDYKIREIVSLREQVANVEQALREAEERHARELAEARTTMYTYLRVWLRRSYDMRNEVEGLTITQDELREAAKGPALAFDVEPDGETLKIREVPDPERSAP
jgi:hypothetical protein